jgi:hypothetical protein
MFAPGSDAKTIFRVAVNGVAAEGAAAHRIFPQSQAIVKKQKFAAGRLASARAGALG